MSDLYDEPPTYLKRVGTDDLYAWELSDQPAIADRAETLSGPAVTHVTPASGLTIGTPTVVGSQVRVRLSGGTDGVDYLLRCTVSTSGGSTLVEYGIVRVRT